MLPLLITDVDALLNGSGGDTCAMIIADFDPATDQSVCQLRGPNSDGAALVVPICDVENGSGARVLVDNIVHVRMLGISASGTPSVLASETDTPN